MSFQNLERKLFAGNEKRLNGSHLLQIEEKSDQMLGATVVVSRKGDTVLVTTFIPIKMSCLVFSIQFLFITSHIYGLCYNTERKLDKKICLEYWRIRLGLFDVSIHLGRQIIAALSFENLLWNFVCCQNIICTCVTNAREIIQHSNSTSLFTWLEKNLEIIVLQ